MQPLITVVTVCFNSEKTIAKTIESVLAQELSNVEYLIVDGVSTDSTLKVVKSYENAFQGKMRIISEPDEGWYDAMNKGVKNAFGDFIVFLNSDDYFDDNAIDTVQRFIKENNIKSDAIVYGDSTNIYRNSKGEILFRRIVAPEHISIDEKNLRDGMCGIRHQSMFTGKKVFSNVGLLDLSYRLHADWDFLVKCVKQEVPMHHIPQNLTYYSMYGASTRPNYKERHQLRKDNRLYRLLDTHYIKDRWGIKVIIKNILGEKKWNDLLFSLHEKRGTGV